MKLTSTFLAIACLFLQTSFVNAKTTNCFPKTDLQIPERFGFHKTGISKEEFNKALDIVDEIYTPIFEKKGLTLHVARLWDNDFINASAEPTKGNVKERKLNMYGGLARYPKMTVDGFLMVACHEVGHHIGGAPLYRDPIEVIEDFESGKTFAWYAASEGQSDYFASLKCARKVFARDNNQEIVSKMKVPASIQQKCAATFSDAEELAICKRSAMAGEAVANILADLMRTRDPKIQDTNIETPSKIVVEKTNNTGYPSLQCRTDTFLQGALCHVDHRMSVSDDNADLGACSRRYGDQVGMRPLCWYKPGSERHQILLASGY